MIEVSIRPETVENPPRLTLLAEADEEPAVQVWQGWFSPQDERDGGHSDR